MVRTPHWFRSAAGACIATAACGGSDRSTPPLIACQAPGDSELYIAVEKYLTTVEPKPRRFLVAVGTDSTLPDAGRSALQHRGPTFLYPADSAHRATLQQHLDSLQDVPTLLVSFGGVKQPRSGELQVVLASRYVGGKNAGESHPARAFRFTCDTARWRFQDIVTLAPKSTT